MKNGLLKGASMLVQAQSQGIQNYIQVPRLWRNVKVSAMQTPPALFSRGMRLVYAGILWYPYDSLIILVTFVQQAIAPHHCFWCYDHSYTRAANDHCISGCVSSGSRASAGCPTPKPQPTTIPAWKGTVPSKSNISGGLPLISGATHTTIYNATLPNGSPNYANGTYNHGPIPIFHDGLYWISWVR